MKYLSICIICLLILSSCAHQAYNEFGRDIKNIEIQTRNNTRKLEEIEAKLSQLPSSTTQLMQDIGSLYRTITDLSENLEKISRDVNELNIALRDIQDRTDMIIHRDRLLEPDRSRDRVETETITEVPEVTREKPTIMEPEIDIKPEKEEIEEEPDFDQATINELEDLYQDAYTDYVLALYTVAIDRFKTFIKRAEKVKPLEYAVIRAYFYKGECYFITNDHNNALASYEKYIQEVRRARPSEHFLPDTYYRKIIIYKELGMLAEARRYHEILKNEFPHHIRTKDAGELSL